ncbi:allophanate hydrolase subunit 1 [Solwaraspora sp. WMMD406]|uniref:5-oxoprolinase subunit B family protein n=1 Tax=Solwaraspora sp. WMMD406 TaxID=3016095 RepID=UPI0024180C8C|nr:allophanate hydrolase subunit 1 [Solwaraspora sp. WMMD406]MDG4762933.1 allophanate hydrolase subunit 1 [Solwaraspora sp. WMMD406]
MRIRTVGRHALLLEWAAAGADREVWRAELFRRRDLGDLDAVDIVPGARTILLDGLVDVTATAREIAAWSPAPIAVADQHGPSVTIPTRYDGPDLPAVADHWGVSAAAVVDRLVDTEFRVAFCGFAPGFAYLAGLPAAWAVPRRPTPRPAVPAGSVALAGEYAGIYPTASPGGWQLVGHTDAVLFDLDRDPPATLTPGTRVRLALR